MACKAWASDCMPLLAWHARCSVIGVATRQSTTEAVVTSDERLAEGRRDERSGGVGATFAHIASRISEVLGSAWAFLVAALIILIWAITGPVFGFSDTWQLVINTGTTIVTFLMVFVIQNTQNRDSKATQLKLDELLRAVDNARMTFIGAEDEDEAKLNEQKEEFEAEKADDAEQVGVEEGVSPGLAEQEERSESDRNG